MNTTKIREYTKLEIAEIQLNRAIKVLIEEGDVVSSITLSGAADDILWKSIEIPDGKKTGRKSQLTEVADEVEWLCRQNEIPFNRNDFMSDRHIYRTELKHLSTEFSSEKIPIPFEAAIEIIDRCCENLRRLTGRYPAKMPLLDNLR